MVDAIPIFRPALPSADEVLPYLRGLDERRIYTNRGPLVRELEASYADFLDVPADCVVAVSSGTAGLIAALLTTEKEDWIVPAWTFVATPLALLRSGKNVIPWDVDCRTVVLDGRAQEEYPEAGVLPVTPFGSAPDLSVFINGSALVLDAAASVAVSRGRLTQLGPEASAVFSLHATKILGCGEGGVVVCGSTELSERLRAAITFGLKDRMTTEIQGLNAKMSEVTAAYALAALDQAPMVIPAWERQSREASCISEQLGIRRIAPTHGSIGPYWIVKVAGGRREMNLVQSEMSKRGIETRRWWPEVITSMSNVRFPRLPAPAPCAEDLASTALGLPLSVDQSPSEFDRIAAALEVSRAYLEPA